MSHPDFLLQLGLALFLSAGGFYRVVYFVSLGYAFSITAMAVALVFLHSLHPPLLLIHTALLGLYGVRLGGYLIARQFHKSYQKELAGIEARSKGITFPIRIAIWISVSLLYVLMFSPAPINLAAARSGAPLRTLLPGVLIMGAGLLLEALADWQKSRYKAAHPDHYCDVGLYRLVRCPNYLGEVVFWIGNFVAGFSAYHHPLHYLEAGIGLVCIVLIMMGSTKRLEKTQDERYGKREDYQHYIKTTPVLFPFVPLYSLKNIRVYLE